MDTLIFILELTGMPAFAISGAALGMRKGMDARRPLAFSSSEQSPQLSIKII